jgi:hypothetical protein
VRLRESNNYANPTHDNDDIMDNGLIKIKVQFLMDLAAWKAALEISCTSTKYDCRNTRGPLQAPRNRKLKAVSADSTPTWNILIELQISRTFGISNCSRA